MKQRYKLNFGNKQFVVSLLLAVLFLIISLFANFYAGTYATEKASNPVTDIILSNTRAYNLDGIFIYGTIVMILIMFCIGLWHPERLPFGIKSIAFFVIVRDVFMSLTHIGPFPPVLVVHSDILSKFIFGGDLFFSGHTGLPFLMALMFWDKPIIRYSFLGVSIFFGVVVLLAHLHYTIDVVSAFFITYTIFHICQHLFKKDFERFDTRIA